MIILLWLAIVFSFVVVFLFSSTVLVAVAVAAVAWIILSVLASAVWFDLMLRSLIFKRSMTFFTTDSAIILAFSVFA